MPTVIDNNVHSSSRPNTRYFHKSRLFIACGELAKARTKRGIESEGVRGQVYTRDSDSSHVIYTTLGGRGNLKLAALHQLSTGPVHRSLFDSVHLIQPTTPRATARDNLQEARIASLWLTQVRTRRLLTLDASQDHTEVAQFPTNIPSEAKHVPRW